jgi:hypothetical protein
MIVLDPIVKEDASTVSREAVEAQALMLADVVPVTDTSAPTVNIGARVALAPGPVVTRMSEVLPFALKMKPSMDPPAP